MQRSFIWEDNENHKHIHAVKWGDITKPKYCGGLGIRNMEYMNEACLLKLCWKLKFDENSLRCNVMKGKYDRENLFQLTVLDVLLAKTHDSNNGLMHDQCMTVH